MLEGGIDVAGKGLEAGGIVGGLPSFRFVREPLRQKRSCLLLAALIRRRERDLEVFPGLRLERFARLRPDCEDECLRFDGDCLTQRVRPYMDERRRPCVERLRRRR